MTPSNLADTIEGLIVQANGKYASRILQVQNKLYNDLVTILRFVDLDSQGYIKQNSGNRAILRAAQDQFDKTIKSSIYQYALEQHLNVIPEIDALNTSYFESVSSAFKPNRVFIKSLQTQTIESVNTLILQDGLAAQIKLPLNQILQQNINMGGSFNGMLDQVKTFVKGNESIDGRLVSYSKGILHDTLFQYARSFQNSVTEDLGLVWYRYVGGLMDKSREFCIERNGGYFHQKEVERWAELDWKGKNNLTTESSIFVFCGGYSCRHQLIPVSDIAVPTDDKARLN